jgi:hypothetical protein
LLRAYKDFESRVGKIRRGKGAKTDQIYVAVERHVAPFAISDIERDCPTTRRDIQRLLVKTQKEAAESGGKVIWIMESTTG